MKKSLEQMRQHPCNSLRFKADGIIRGDRERRQGQPPWVVALADQAQRRLHRRYSRLLARGKPHNVATVAVARELTGFIWEVLYTHATRSLEAAN